MPKMKSPVLGSINIESINASGIARKDDIPDIRKIDIAYIVDTGNVRKEYTNIEELASSIEEHGLLQPISVKVLDPDPQGLPCYELVAGFRRWKAFQLLHSQGKGFALINAIVVTGDKLILQLIENLQRSDLTPQEREQGIVLLCETIPKGNVAGMLAKSQSFISRNIGAFEIRKSLNNAGVDTTNIDTTVVYILHKIADKDLPAAAKQLIAEGGTKSVAEQIVSWYEAAQKVQKVAGETEPGVHKPTPVNSNPPKAQPESKQTKPEKPAFREPKSPYLEVKDDFPDVFPEKLVHFDDVAKAIIDYIEFQEIDVNRKMAGKEILTLLWKRLLYD
jgi:ParB/RepB/Spo0J family partition protein